MRVFVGVRKVIGIESGAMAEPAIRPLPGRVIMPEEPVILIAWLRSNVARPNGYFCQAMCRSTRRLAPRANRGCLG